ncbi:hypothetical protein C7974DRAFT_96926 [Boeremia exigua]|uniref:uncharacterized protein n=1 Tax=Boeremia exigua TaxID=749465 RepID=UPI001E8E0F12|nr:uncharacterized protein C7974DRAFT_96926 [Boeremia exigua]KAH6642186.1 hypothetical protein C7974DRAFT_96926 [Boeremia exigua]
MASIDSLLTLTLDLPPSCIEFWSRDSQYAVVGTYNLEKEDGSGLSDPAQHEGQQKNQERNGSLILVRVRDDTVEIVQTIATASAILDVHFLPQEGADSIFGVATSTGSIGIYQLDQESANDIPEIVLLQTLQYFPENELITAFSWHPEQSAVGMTLSTGKVCLGKVDLENPSHLDVGLHELEAWTLAFLPDGTGIYSGGDDSALKYMELPRDHPGSKEEISGANYAPSWIMSWSDKKVHSAGVTAILPIHVDSGSSWIVTGSYDDHIRLIEAPTVGRRQVRAEMDLGGGVWRLKVLDKKMPTQAAASSSEAMQPPEELLLLVSCMHAGARVIRLVRTGDDWRFEVVAKFEEHKSMNYGSDSQFGLNANGQRTFISTSFYDRLLCLWRY